MSETVWFDPPSRWTDGAWLTRYLPGISFWTYEFTAPTLRRRMWRLKQTLRP